MTVIDFLILKATSRHTAMARAVFLAFLKEYCKDLWKMNGKPLEKPVKAKV